MAWLHTWTGLWFSWLLFAVFLSGSLAVFEEPIGHWMTPEHHAEEALAKEVVAPEVDRQRRLALAMAYMARAHPDANMWEVWPVHRDDDNGLIAYWLDEQGQYHDAKLDPQTGAVIPETQEHAARATQGGRHFVLFHYELHAGQIGLWIVAFATMGMLVALVSGVVTHKRIFKDFFTFRAKKGQRSWLDAHNAVAVLTLPFQFMIAYTGIVISSNALMPAAAVAQYGTGKEAFQIAAADLTGEGKPAVTGRALAVPDLEPLTQRAEALMGQTARAIVVNNPGDASMRIGIYGWNESDDKYYNLSSTSGMVEFAADTGDIVRMRRAGGVDGGTPSLVRQVMGDLHMVKFGGLTMKWLYFICGLAGAAMMATGGILFIVKRRAKHLGEFGSATATVYRLIESLNVAAIAGLGIACVAYLWANRLIPVTLAHRDDWEIGSFFAIWLLALAHALIRPARRAWVEQLSTLAALCLLLPLMSYLSVNEHLLTHVLRNDWESAGVEITAVIVGILSAWAAIKTATKGRPAPKPGRRSPQQEQPA